MVVTGRMLALAIVASGTLGGGIAALGTAAISSSAAPTPAAVAAAIQKVQDASAERKLGAIAALLSESPSSGANQNIIGLLERICENTAKAPGGCIIAE